MALTYDIKINGVRVDATIGVAVHDKLEEAMDEGALNLPITTFNYPYKILGLLEINISDGTNPDIDYQLLVISDSISVSSKDGFYEHNLTVLEYTHKLDKMFISALTFTQPFYRKARAPFEFKGFIPQGIISLHPSVYVNETYFVNESVTFSQVGQCVATDSGSMTETDVYIRLCDDVSCGTSLNLSTANRTFTMPSTKSNIHYFQIGYIISSTFYSSYDYYIRVIEERRYTLWDMLQRVRAVLPIERESFFDDTRIFDVDSSLQASFEQIEMPQMFFRQQSARQVLNTIFKYINAITRLQYVDGSNDKLTVDFFNKIGLSFDSDDIVEFSNIQNAQNYGTKAIAFLGQTLQANFRENPSLQTPAYDKYKTVRSSNVQLTRDNFQLKLEKPIYEISKISVVIPKIYYFLETAGGTPIAATQKTITNYELDLTARFLEKSFWDLKSSTVDFNTYTQESAFGEEVGMRLNKNGNIFWQRNKNTIDFNLQIGNFIKATLLDEVIQEALNEEITVSAYDSIWYDGVDFSANAYLLAQPDVFFNDDAGSGFIDKEKIFRNLKFNVEYITLEDTVAQVDRQDISENNYDAYLRINSLESISNFQRTARDMFGKLERSAVPVKTIAKVHTDLSDVLSVGQIDADGFIITERRLVLHNEFIEGIYTATKDHNRLNEFNGINQAFRAFEIPTYGESVKRKDFYTDYVFITNPDNTLKPIIDEDNETLFNAASFTDNLFAHLRNVNGRNKATFAMIKTDGFDSVYPSVTGNYKAIMTPIVSFGGKGGLNFTFDFESNQVAGDSIVKSDQNLWYNQPVRYTDEQGFFDKLWFGIGYDYNDSFDVNLTNIGDSDEDYFNEEYSYPLIQSTSPTLSQTFMIKNGLANNPDWFNIYKDAATSYGFAYHLSIIPDDYSEYVIGQSFYTENPLVYYTDTPKTLKLYVYPTLTTYNKFDDLKIKSGWSNSYNLSASVLGYSSGVFSFLGSYSQYVGSNANWAIGDEDENLYLACNTNHNGWKAYSRHLHPNLIQIGNK